MQNPTRFGLDNRGTKVCEFCGVRSWADRQDSQTGRLCSGCFDSAGYENEHLDGYHADQAETQCPTCNPAFEARRLAKCAERVAGYQTTALKESERQAAKAAKEAAKQASIKHCAGSDWNGRPCDGRASKTSDYCSTCRPYHPHTFTRAPQRDIDWVNGQNRLFGRPEIVSMCGSCGNEKTDPIHEEAN
jgi:hypothetical protein